MKKVTKRVDLNAYIADFKCEVKSENGNKQLSVSFDNLGYGTVVAIRFVVWAKDSFGDEIDFDGNDVLEIKKVDINIKPQKKAGFVCNIKNYDIKELDSKITQIVYDNGKIVVPEGSDIVDYEVEVLSTSWSQTDHFEKDAVEYMRETNSKAICFPAIHPRGWICICGSLNRGDISKCNACGALKDKIFRDFSIENVKPEVEKREKRKQEEEDHQREQQRKAAADAEKKQKMITSSIVGVITIIIAGFIAATAYHNVKYGLSKEEEASYKIAQNNYREIEYFVMRLGNDYWDAANGYNDDNYSPYHDRSSRLNEAEKDKDYLYTRGMYIASPLLYDLIKDQYPQKYHRAYEQLVKLRKGKVYNDYLGEEALYVKQSSEFDYFDKDDAIDTAIAEMEKYMQNETLNPDSVEIKTADTPTPDYSKVYGINLGIIFGDDGSIVYIGESSNGKAEGYGKFHYTDAEGNSRFCSGTFTDGVFVENEKGNKKDDVPEVTGEFVLVTGLENTASSESMANKAAADEERDCEKAKSECKRYLQVVIDKQKGITNIEWITYPKVSENNYYFSCTVEEGGLKRKGTVTVVKLSDGSFEATGLEFDN